MPNRSDVFIRRTMDVLSVVSDDTLRTDKGSAPFLVSAAYSSGNRVTFSATEEQAKILIGRKIRVTIEEAKHEA